MSWWDDFKSGARGFMNTPMDRRAEDAAQYQGIDQSNYQMPGFEGMQTSLGQFADTRGGGPFMQQQQDLASLLMKQAQGQDSFAAAKLQQDMGRLQAQQMGAAVGARPSAAALMSRTAAQNMGNIGAQMAGQSQLAQVAERNAAAQSAGNVIGQGRGQDIGAYLGAQGQLGQNAANQMQGSMGYEANRFGRFQQSMGTPTKGQGLINAFSSVLPFAAAAGGGGGGAGASPGLLQNGPGSDIARSFLPSDVRLKENIVPIPTTPQADLLARQDKERGIWINPTLSPERQAKERASITEAQSKARARQDKDRNIWINPNLSPEEQQAERAKVTAQQAEMLARVPSYSYQYKPGTGLPPGPQVGQMAQDVEKVAPNAVVETEKGKAIDYAKLTPAILALVQQQQAQLEEMKNRLAPPNPTPPAPPPQDVSGISGQLGAVVPRQMADYYRMRGQ